MKLLLNVKTIIFGIAILVSAGAHALDTKQCPLHIFFNVSSVKSLSLSEIRQFSSFASLGFEDETWEEYENQVQADRMALRKLPRKFVLASIGRPEGKCWYHYMMGRQIEAYLYKSEVYNRTFLVVTFHDNFSFPAQVRLEVESLVPFKLKSTTSLPIYISYGDVNYKLKSADQFKAILGYVSFEKVSAYQD